MRIASRIRGWLGRSKRRRRSPVVDVPQMSSVDPKGPQKEIDDQRQKEIDFLKKLLASVANTKVD